MRGRSYLNHPDYGFDTSFFQDPTVGESVAILEAQLKERMRRQQLEEEAKLRRRWSLGLSYWIDRWTPYRISANDLLCDSQRLEATMRSLGMHDGVKMPRA